MKVNRSLAFIMFKLGPLYEITFQNHVMTMCHSLYYDAEQVFRYARRWWWYNKKGWKPSINWMHTKRHLSKHILLLETSCLFTQDTNKTYPLNNQMVVTDISCALLCYFPCCIFYSSHMVVWWIFVVRMRPLQTQLNK